VGITISPNGAGRVAPIYNASFLFYRPPQAKVGNVAAHLYNIWRPLRIELLGQFGTDNSGQNYLGGRPAAILDFGWLKLRGAYEYQYIFFEEPSLANKNTSRNRGGAGSVQVVFAPYVEAGVNAGYAIYDHANSTNPLQDSANSGNELSVGGFVDASPVPAILPNLLLGAGANYATQHNLLMAEGAYEKSTSLQAFFAVQYMFYRQLFVKTVFGYAKSRFQNQPTPSPYDDDMFSVRVRLMYLY
jgi:hypothetical protein